MSAAKPAQAPARRWRIWTQVHRMSWSVAEIHPADNLASAQAFAQAKYAPDNTYVEPAGEGE